MDRIKKTIHYLVTPKNRIHLCGEMLEIVYSGGAILETVEFCYNEPDQVSGFFFAHYNQVRKACNISQTDKFYPKVRIKIMPPDDCRHFLEAHGRYDLDPNWPHLYSYTSWREE